MNEIFQENRKIFFGLIILLFILLIVLYFALLRPLIAELKGTESQIETLEGEVERLKVAVEEQEETEWDMADSRKKVPASKELDPLLLALEEIEAVSGSHIENIDFFYDSELPEATLAGEEESETEVVEEEETDNEEEVEDRDGIDLSEIPEGLKTISARMTVLSPDYEHFRQFIVEVHRNERIMLVDALEFEKPAEAQLLDNPEEETISFTIDFLTFYYES